MTTTITRWSRVSSMLVTCWNISRQMTSARCDLQYGKKKNCPLPTDNNNKESAQQVSAKVLSSVAGANSPPAGTEAADWWRVSPKSGKANARISSSSSEELDPHAVRLADSTARPSRHPHSRLLRSQEVCLIILIVTPSRHVFYTTIRSCCGSRIALLVR